MNSLKIFFVFFVCSISVYVIPTYVQAADYYFQDLSNDWSDPDNWFFDSGFSSPASSVPGSGDNAYVDSNIYDVSGDPPDVNNLYLGTTNDAVIEGTFDMTIGGNLYVGQTGAGRTSTYIALSGSINVTGTANFYDNSTFNSGTLNGNANFNDNSIHYGYIYGNANFYDNSYQYAYVDGNSVFHGNNSVFVYDYVDAYIGGTKTRYYNTTSSSTLNFVNSGPWIVVADGAVVSLDGALIDTDNLSATYTTLSEISAGQFVYGPFTVDTIGHTGVTQAEVTLEGSIIGTNGNMPTSRGFEYGTTLSYGSSFYENGNFPAGDFTLFVTGLTPGTLYHYRTYATNSNGTVYGDDMTFTTDPLLVPSVTSSAASSVNYSSAVMNGDITSTGGADVTTRGFIYGTTTAYGATTTASGTFGTGTFNYSLTSLTSSTTYHYKAYATNSVGTTYGSDITFNTAAIVAPTISVTSVTGIYADSVTLTGLITSVGGANATSRGFVYGTTTAYGATTTNSGSFGIAEFAINLSDLEPLTTYYFAAYATNSAGTGYSASSTFSTTAENQPVLRKLSSITTSAGPFSNAVISTSTIVTIGYNCDCITVHDVSDKSNPITLAASTTNTDPGAVVASGNYAYITTYGGKLETWDISNPSLPTRTNVYSFSAGRGAGKIKIEGNYLYTGYSQSGFSSPGGFAIFDISNPASPSIVSLTNFVANTSGNGDVLPDGNYLYIADYFGYTLRVYNITNKASPVLLQNISGITDSLDYKGANQFEPWRLLKKNNTLYLSDDNVIKIYDISSSSNMVYVRSVSAGRDIEGLAIRGNIMYYSSSGVSIPATYKRLELYDISDPFNPFLIHTVYTGQTNYWVSIDDDGYVYINSTSDHKLNIYDIIDPPTLGTNSVSATTKTSVTLNSAISDNNNASTTNRGFHYGTTVSYGLTANTSGATNPTSFSESISGLTCGTTYHYRSFATNYVGTATSSDSTFTTSDCDVVESTPAPTTRRSGSTSASTRVSNLLAQGNTQLAQQIASQYNVAIPAMLPTPFGRNLTLTYTGLDVKALQQYLNSKGYTLALTGPGSPGNETTKFGFLTRSALARFQSANGIYPAVGYFGPITRAFVKVNP